MEASYFATWLDRTLAEQGISGGAVARALGVSDGVVSRWKNGKGRPKLDNVRRLATFLEVDLFRLMVTAGLMSADEAGVEPLPVPEDTRTRDLVIEQINSIKFLSDEDRHALIEAYDRKNGNKA